MPVPAVSPACRSAPTPTSSRANTRTPLGVAPRIDRKPGLGIVRKARPGGKCRPAPWAGLSSELGKTGRVDGLGDLAEYLVDLALVVVHRVRRDAERDTVVGGARIARLVAPGDGSDVDLRRPRAEGVADLVQGRRMGRELTGIVEALERVEGCQERLEPRIGCGRNREGSGTPPRRDL